MYPVDLENNERSYSAIVVPTSKDTIIVTQPRK
jgi:hypothetical protein